MPQLQPHTFYILIKLSLGLQQIRKGSVVEVTYREPGKEPQHVSVRVSDVDRSRGLIKGATVTHDSARSVRVEISVMDSDLRVETKR